MKYESTRSSIGGPVSSAEAIVQGIAPDGGLYAPISVPSLPDSTLPNLVGRSYVERAQSVLSPFFDDFPSGSLRRAIEVAYGGCRFGSRSVAPLFRLSGSQAVMELWHGPTSAFKDVALQLLPQMILEALTLTGENRRIAILVATSGDTGKAALEGFRDLPGVRVVVFYPADGVSEVQRLQMVTQQGENVNVFGISGDFDDAQSGVKHVFADLEFGRELESAGWMLSSANSINWGRLAPQIVYYVSAYCDSVASGAIECGDRINFVVPSGNFGNILAAYYAMRMGLPINRLVCAANRNNVLADFFSTGVYDRRRALYPTTSPSMDILVSSNLERLLFEASDHSHSVVRELMTGLQSAGWYSVGSELLQRLQSVYWAGWCDEGVVMETIRDVWSAHNYVLDPHTAVGQAVYRQYASSTGDDTFTVLVSTASPFKFPRVVLRAIAGEEAVGTRSELECIDVLQELSGLAAPRPLAELRQLQPTHTKTVDVAEIQDAVASALQEI